ncbi:hypothetical protein H5410_051409 [Solanum commersonii]|uniref:Uncharacterized protein n=1 Tax=Solanum commersonii TaxID=4109 RepID=A0A9J5X0L9_SOLCO|nr:hypothetical protein H5410_051409 [Solanum commersonii]
MNNAKEKMARTITKEHRVLTRSFHTIPDILQFFQRHKCEWMAHDPGTYSKEIVQEFYPSYAATLRGRKWEKMGIPIGENGDRLYILGIQMDD